MESNELRARLENIEKKINTIAEGQKIIISLLIADDEEFAEWEEALRQEENEEETTENNNEIEELMETEKGVEVIKKQAELSKEEKDGRTRTRPKQESE